MPDRPDWLMVLGKAQEDLIAVRELIANRAVNDSIVGFHAQQAVEKALKAWIGMQGREWPWTHDLALLIDLLEHLGIDMSAYRPLDRLTPFAVHQRYVDLPWSEDVRMNRESLLREVEALVAQVVLLAGLVGG